MSNAIANSNINSSDISVIVPDTINFSLQRFIRQHEIDACVVQSGFTPDKCACVLSGSKDLLVCAKGYAAAQAQSSDKSDQLNLLKWCASQNPNSPNSSSTEYQSWHLGCFNGIRK